jgi:hypothetical protein
MQTDVTIPLDLFNGKYSLDEIATVCVLFASPHLLEKTRLQWADNQTCNDVTVKLVKEGIITIHDDRIEIDISEKIPMSITDKIENILINSNLNRETINEVLDLVESIPQESSETSESIVRTYGKKEDY